MSIPYMDASELKAVREAFLRTTARVCPTQLELAEQTLERVPLTRWQLEWFLPCWLGEAYGLDKGTAREFVLSNILGLAAIRLKDDIADGDVPATDVGRVMELGDGLEAAALEIYVKYFHPGAPFWDTASEYLSQWRIATERVNRLALPDFAVMWDKESDAARCAAQLGAPLKISARAVWELTRGEGAFDVLDRLLDSASSAAVLHDHAVDWNADLGAGRWNFFIAAISPLPQERAFENENRARVIRAWMEAPRSTTPAETVANMPYRYFDLIELHIERAQRYNETLCVKGLGQYLDGFRGSVCGTRDAMTRYFHEQLVRATDSLFGERFILGHARATHEPTGRT